MKTIVAILVSFFVCASVLPAAAANNCAQAATQVAQARNAQVLQVDARQQSGQVVCQITIRVPGKNGKPPRVETVQVNG